MNENQEENKFLELLEVINKIPIPSWIKKNIITALAKGIGQMITAGLDWPTAWFEAQAREIRARAAGNEMAQQEAAKQVSELFKTDSNLANRSLNYYANKIVTQQINREDVAKQFLIQVENQEIEENTIEADIDEDWLNSFWTISETKTSEEIKFILGKILAKEAIKPKSVSPVTLQLIPILTSDIGLTFHKFCNLSIRDKDFVFVVHPKVGAFRSIGDLSDYGISLEEQLELEGVGLIRSINVIPLQITPDNGDFQQCEYAGIPAKFNFHSSVNIIDFTRAGIEIRNLLDLKPNQDYTNYLLSLGSDKFQLVK